ncbi:MAG: bifunctional DNA-binding transcriptional regulator/O6-methylguanine-DNA methyltransferase Ada [Candidatus Accumulibacter sp.]|uniref:methylated-DNA--[protein]-cysteine S-methyltransferase n=1 Tax=Candidatus Accumulibacter proximus TaxID=2954385 RepID=A0A935UI07_9PROT|nr:bifunctional DNA-binding transcriptional regulator/O6-methylguanine-DNA methyltransferase Ada [Candidatus Accumulibacter proximus]
MASADKQARIAATLADARWIAVISRDPAADGSFVYSVASTGVYCRPTCPSRRPGVEQVAFHASATEAEAAGFRPCRRCTPDGQSLTEKHAATVAALCRFIETAAQAPTLAELAARSGISAHHLHRLFKATTGLTPRAYAAAQRAQRIRHQLQHSPTVTEAIYGAGYSSSGRFYEESRQLLGMTPSDYRAGGANSTIRFALGECSLGSILVAHSGRGICSILIGDDPQALAHDLQDRFPAAELIGGDAGFERLVAGVVGLVEAPGLGHDLPLDIRGTAFQQRVWQALQESPPGGTTSYSELARRIGSPGSARAVAGACAANVLAVAIPCHRVVRSDGSLSGYRWGVERKRALLEREAAPQLPGLQATGTS